VTPTEEQKERFAQLRWTDDTDEQDSSEPDTSKQKTLGEGHSKPEELEGEPALIDKSSLEESKTDSADVNSNGQPRSKLTSVDTSLPDDIKGIRPATLIQLHKLGFKLLPLSVNNAVVIPWTPDMVFIPAFKDLDGRPNELRSETGDLLVRERHVGVTTEQLADKTKKVYGGLKPSSGDVSIVVKSIQTMKNALFILTIHILENYIIQHRKTLKID